jgi:hypothetical protein
MQCLHAKHEKKEVVYKYIVEISNPMTLPIELILHLAWFPKN